ncbi:DEAD/DEAH box helicase [Achromobacter spanius]|uniref:DNA helicase n=1 Tax=Achromobacter spanius TaxID=217203 RepID=A0A2S0I4I5_9BURK|nr:ATP-binding domain-containing protein [Achromobacter spanius]AVJ26941.1 DNA helicase [Achromobacter spanius]
MSEYCYFSTDAQDYASRCGLKQVIEDYAEANQKQTYVLRAPLSKNDASYDYDDAIVIFSSGLLPCFVNLGSDEIEFEGYVEDFIDDISFLSEKFKYREKIGRKKHWESLFKTANAKSLDLSSLITEHAATRRIVDLLTSLVVGSINDMNRINLEASSLLDIIKSKIILFDTDQTSFVFRSAGSKTYAIQGLAGSGKTELLLHKLKEIYSKEPDARIAFTCFNKILAHSMRSRIPEFFDFMRVDRQIEWNSKLFCFHAWGSGKVSSSGMYRYICHFYGISFGNMYGGTFDAHCTRAISDIRALPGERKFAFDYVLIDESQDFAPSFVQLCELVTATRVFVAGDVFQNIFQPIDKDSVSRADMVLKKCYRTDPSNLMFSHALGMGLFENPVLRWLKPEEWDACGYSYEEENGRAIVARDPLRRFEDIPQDFKSTTIHSLEGADPSKALVQVIMDIRDQHPTAKQGDFAIIFIDSEKYIYDLVPALSNRILRDLGWESNISYESKTNDPTKLFISNINNAKGLEFPFVICFAKDLKAQAAFRNALYTMMARSFLESHLVLGNRADANVVAQVSAGLDFMLSHGYMDIRVPTDDELLQQNSFVILEQQRSLEEIVRDYCLERNASARLTAKLISRINIIVGNEDYDENYIIDMLNVEYERNVVL